MLEITENNNSSKLVRKLSSKLQK